MVSDDNMGVDGSVRGGTLEKFIELSKKGNVIVMLPQNPNYDKLSSGAIGRIQYHDKNSNLFSNYGTLFIKEVTDCDGKVLEPESYAFQGAREIKLGTISEDGVSKVYGEIVFGSCEVPSADNLKVYIEFI